MRSLAIRFSSIFWGRASSKLDFWIDDAVSSGLTPIVRFAGILHCDIGAVRNVIELPWSNGQAEGQINRLKTIKRCNVLAEQARNSSEHGCCRSTMPNTTQIKEDPDQMPTDRKRVIDAWIAEYPGTRPDSFGDVSVRLNRGVD
jgi:hypothetical protein